MITVSPGPNGDPAHWRLINRGQHGADVLAMAPIGATAYGNWQDAVECVRDGRGELKILSTADGHFQWTLADSRDVTIAQSPAIYRDADDCRQAFTFAQRVARTALGAGYHRTVFRAPPPTSTR
jgi:hypothetical protein